MFFDNVIENDNREGFVSTFLGYNHNPIISEAEFYEMENMTSDNFPLLSPRAKRQSVLDIRSEEYDSLDVEVEVTYEADVSKAVVTYTYDMDIEKDLLVDVSVKHLDVFSETTFTYKEIDDKGIVQNEETIDITEDLTYDNTNSYDNKHLQIVVVGKFTDPEDFDPEDIETYVYDFVAQEQNPTIRGMLVKDNKLAYFIEDTLYFDNDTFDFSDYIEEEDKNSKLQMLSMGAYIIVFPLNIYFNTQDHSDMGRLDSKVKDSGTVQYKLCKVDGSSYNATESSTAPENPTNNQYWLDTSNTGLYVWSDYNKSWNAVLTTYISIKFPSKNPSNYFKEGDAVFMNTKFEDLNNGSIIQHVGTDYIVVIGIMNSSTSSETITFECERKVPLLDFTCISGNRVWGCRKGLSENGENVNEIYASKLGDPKNWFAYAGDASDSYAISLGDDGDFTGCVSYQGLPTFFKENTIYKVYGSYPAQYTLYTYDQRGVQKGSERSLAVCGDYLIYKSLVDVCIYDGNKPTTISTPLGREVYTKAVGGSTMNKYYLSMIDSKGSPNLFVYDIDRGLWHREDNLYIEEFSYNNLGQLYGFSNLSLYTFGLQGSDFSLYTKKEEKHVDWFVETGITGISFPAHKYVNELTIRAKIEYGSVLRVYVSYDSEPFEELQILQGVGNVESYNFPLNPARADHYRLRLEGRDSVLIYSIASHVEEGSEEDGI